MLNPDLFHVGFRIVRDYPKILILQKIFLILSTLKWQMTNAWILSRLCLQASLWT